MQVAREFDFDSFIDRENTESLKWDARERRGYPETVLPMWVADMDHRTAPAVVQALHDRVAHGIFGYTSPDASYFETVAAWQSRRFGWDVDPMSIVATGGVIPALTYAVRAFTEPGDGVVIEEPVYYPFRSIVENNGRIAVNAPLARNGEGRYVRDLAALEATFVDSGARTMILCNPHNPVGRVWTREELLGLADLAAKLDVIVLSDEIHADLTYPGIRTTPFSSLPGMSNRTATFTSPSKSFNLAGLQLANIVVPDRKRRQDFIRESNAAGYSEPNALGLAACRAAYDEGEEWLDAFREHMAENLEFLAAALEGIDGIELVEPEGTYLPWLDCRELIRNLGIEAGELDEFMVNEADLWLDDGAIFGDEGLGYTRINIACPRSTLKEAVDRLRRAVEAQSVSDEEPASTPATATFETAPIDSAEPIDTEASAGPETSDDSGASAGSASSTDSQSPGDSQEASRARQNEAAERTEGDS